MSRTHRDAELQTRSAEITSSLMHYRRTIGSGTRSFSARNTTVESRRPLGKGRIGANTSRA
jgi:hypothetical protein